MIANLQNQLQKILTTRFGGFYLFIGFFLFFSLIIRFFLLVKTFDSIEFSLLALLQIFGIGVFYDCIAAINFGVLLVLYLIFIPDRIFKLSIHRFFYSIFFFFIFYLLIFDGVAEWIFWDEFGVRYNFIAVDYLVYTHEVIGNIRQSYPVPLLLTIIFIITAIIWYFIKQRGWFDLSFATISPFKQRISHGFIILTLPGLLYLGVDQSLAENIPNRFNSELAKNGIYSLFSAFINNELEYDRFYLKQEDQQAFARVRQLLITPNAKLIHDDPFDITRMVKNSGPEKHLNVIYLTIESMSAEFMGLFGNTENWTPNLDLLAKESLTFTNLYATGNRTDRGMESLVLSIPPTPGRSKVKRPNNEDLFSVGFLFQERGYDTQFIYGGYGYFDNMNYFFGHNGFGVVDRTQLDATEITQENIWGVADEDLFRRTLKEADRAYAIKKPFFHFVMTTSNHRPFTYPDGRIDIPSPGGRAGGVKYTDWAIGKFIQQAKSHPWFKDTVFVIMADHCAGSAGKTELPVARYHIPLMIYSPAHIAPRMEEALTSQIDITPTVLGLLNWSYATRFYGQDILRSLPETRRAFIGTYQKLGLITQDRLTVLSPQHKASFYQFVRGWGKESQQLLSLKDSTSLQDAISFYQTTNTMRLKGLDKKLP